MIKRLREVRSLKTLHQLNQTELKLLWNNEFKTKPPSNMKALLRPLSYKYQELTINKLNKCSKDRIKYYIKLLDNNIEKKKRQTLIVREGTVFKRKYKGKKYTVLFTNGKYLYNNNEYNSLSAIANEITNSITSGIKFFGVRKRKQ